VKYNIQYRMRGPHAGDELALFNRRTGAKYAWVYVDVGFPSNTLRAIRIINGQCSPLFHLGVVALLKRCRIEDLAEGLLINHPVALYLRKIGFFEENK